jgi:hypothetical protein
MRLLQGPEENDTPGYVDFRASVGLRKIGDVWGNIEGAEGCKVRCGSEILGSTHIYSPNMKP